MYTFPPCVNNTIWTESYVQHKCQLEGNSLYTKQEVYTTEKFHKVSFCEIPFHTLHSFTKCIDSMSLRLNTLKNFSKQTKCERQKVVEILKHFSASRYHQYPQAYTWNNMPNMETIFIAFISFYFCPPLLIQIRKPLACRGDEFCLKLIQNPYI